MRISAIVALVTTVGFAQQTDSLRVNQLNEVVISDTKFAQSKEKSGKVITKISAEELQKKSGQSLAMILSTVAGVEINGSQSANGKNLGYYIRGGKNQQVLILIDGNPVTDASGISFEYDLRLLPVDQVESIEIMKGAASTLYGTGAATAVINVTLKKSSKKAIQANAYINIGSNNTARDTKVNGQDFNQGFSVNGTLKSFTYLASINSTETNGMSQIANPDENTNYEFDRFSRLNYRTKLGFELTENFSFDVFGNYDLLKNDYDWTFDNTGFSDTDGNTTQSEQFRAGFSPKFKYNKGELVLNSSFTQLRRSYSEWNASTSVYDSSLYQSRNANVDLFNKYRFNNKLFLILGVNYQFFDMMSETPFGNIAKESTKFNAVDVYYTGVYNSNFGLNLNVGARLNVHSEYGNQLVYNVNPSFSFGKQSPIKLLASYSTAYVTPSLYQLYSEFGNLELIPEQNQTIEAGFEVAFWNKKVSFNAVAFHREQKDSFGFFYDEATFESYYINIDGLNKAKGIEAECIIQFSKAIKLNGNYTFTQVDEALNRLIPKHKGNVSVDFTPTQRTSFSLNYQYVDARWDAFFDGNAFETVKNQLDAYQLLNALLQYEVVKKRLTVFGNVTNIWNEDFVENTGYSTRGRNFRLGLTLTL